MDKREVFWIFIPMATAAVSVLSGVGLEALAMNVSIMKMRP